MRFAANIISASLVTIALVIVLYPIILKTYFGSPLSLKPELWRAVASMIIGGIGVYIRHKIKPEQDTFMKFVYRFFFMFFILTLFVFCGK